MKRWALRIILCLILGAVTTVAVAWSFALLFDSEIRWKDSVSYFGDVEDQGFTHQFSRDCGVGWEHLEHVRSRTSETNISGLQISRPLVEAPFHWCRIPQRSDWILEESLSYGWPLTAMDYYRIFPNPYPQRASRNGWYVSGELSVETGARPAPNVPLNVVPPWFVVDTLFYAAIWFGVFFGFASAKRAIRRRRGRCPRCGYDLRGGVISDERLAISGEGALSTAGCPECGWNRRMQEEEP